jgi:hypothetical protein
MNYPLIVLLEIITLFFLARLLTKTLSQLIHSFTGSTRSIVFGIAFLFLPGTLLHELAHYLMAKILFVYAGQISLLPKLEGEMLKMGSVQVGHTDPLRKLLIGVAPLIAGCAILLGIYYFFSTRTGILYSWQILIPIVATFEIANTMFSSRKDMEGTLGLFLVLGISVLIGLIFHITFPSWVVANILDILALPFFQTLSIYLSIPLILDIILVGLVKIFVR